jgi:hypothetical protein
MIFSTTTNDDGSPNLLKQIINGLAVMCLISCMVIIVWNILNFVIFQWFGFRYYGFTIRSMYFGFICLLTTAGPVIVGAAHQAAPLGIALSIVGTAITLFILRLEAAAYRNTHG